MERVLKGHARTQHSNASRKDNSRFMWWATSCTKTVHGHACIPWPTSTWRPSWAAAKCFAFARSLRTRTSARSLPTSPRWAAIRHFVSSALTIMVSLPLLSWTYVLRGSPSPSIPCDQATGTKISPWHLLCAMDWVPFNANLATSKQPM